MDSRLIGDEEKEEAYENYYSIIARCDIVIGM